MSTEDPNKAMEDFFNLPASSTPAPQEEPVKPKRTFMGPAATGRFKKDNIFHMSIDELIAYKVTGERPRMIIDESYIYKLAVLGVSIDNICGLFQITKESFCNNKTFLTAHQNGRANLATKNRAAIAECAANGSLDAMKYIDKYIGGDISTENVNLSVSQRPLETASTDDLIEIALNNNEDHKD